MNDSQLCADCANAVVNSVDEHSDWWKCRAYKNFVTGDDYQLCRQVRGKKKKCKSFISVESSALSEGFANVVRKNAADA